jgi:hypothetical protein
MWYQKGLRLRTAEQWSLPDSRCIFPTNVLDIGS